MAQITNPEKISIHASDRRERIEELLKSGMSKYAIEKLGYSRSTIHYIHRKLFKPKKYKAYLEKMKKQTLDRYYQKKLSTDK